MASFSRASSSFRATSHSDRDTIFGWVILISMGWDRGVDIRIIGLRAKRLGDLDAEAADRGGTCRNEGDGGDAGGTHGRLLQCMGLRLGLTSTEPPGVTG